MSSVHLALGDRLRAYKGNERAFHPHALENLNRTPYSSNSTVSGENSHQGESGIGLFN